MKKIFSLITVLMVMLCLAGISSAALLNNSPKFPMIAYDSNGTTQYDAANDRLAIQATPIAITLVQGGAPILFQPGGSLQINIGVNDTGALVDGGYFTLEGTVDPGSGLITGVLLSGEVKEFGFYNSSTSTDKFDFRISLAGGALASLYSGYDIGVVTVSENSTFSGDFTVDFSGGAKGNVFAITKPAAIGDFVWSDLNGDGVQDQGEPGFGGVTVELYTCADVVTPKASTITDGSGFYHFENLAPGDYFIKFVLPLGAVFSPMDQGGVEATDSDADPTTGRTICTTLSSGETDLTWDAGIYEPAALGDFVWKDLNANGIQDAGELGMPGVTVNLHDCSNNFVGATTTDLNGLYLFSNLTPGQYYVEFVLPSGSLFSPIGQGGDMGKDSDADPVTGKTACTELTPGENDLTWDAGVYQPAAIGDFVWLDGNKNGIQDAGEAGIQGVTVRLYACGDVTTPVDTKLTNAGGYYLFDNLKPGCYVVEFVKPNGYEFSFKDMGMDDVDSDVSPSGYTDQISLLSGTMDLTWDAGLVIIATAEIGDFVWEDLNGDGIQDAGEQGIENVTVSLYDCLGNLVAETVTDQNGFYLFEDLLAGNYYVVFGKPAGYLASPQHTGTNDGQDSDADLNTGMTACTTLAFEESDRTWDAGFFKPASLGDLVWADLNFDGIQDAGEPGIAGVVVKLFDCNAALVAQTTTDAAGNYLFDHLIPGNYFVTFIAPAGYVFSPMDEGANDGLDSDAEAGTGITICTTLQSGENDRTWDAGLILEPCNLSVAKSCWVPTTPAGNFTCAKPIDSITLIWNGIEPVKIKAWKGLAGSTLLAEIDGIVPGQAVTVNGYAGSPNDVIWELFKAGTTIKIGESTFHLSCSDDDMDGAEDCGKVEGDGKGKTGYINKWLLGGMTDSNGSFNCYAINPNPGTQNCEITVPSRLDCGDGKLKSVVLKYVGGNCSKTTNWQNGKVTCGGDAALNEPIGIVIKKDADIVKVSPSTQSINIGDHFTISAGDKLEANTYFDIVQNGVVLQSLAIHTSCSQPIAVGDRFGSVQIVSMDLVDGSHLGYGTEVEYTYVVKNVGPMTVQNITVNDNLLGPIPGSPIASLAPGKEAMLTAKAMIDKTTTNFVTVSGQTVYGGTCSAIDSSTVTVSFAQPECVATGKSTIKVDKKGSDEIEWEIYNSGKDPITIETLTLGWPTQHGKLKKISIEKDTIFEPAAGPTPPSAVITAWKAGIDKRQIEAGKKAKLKFKFEKKSKTGANQYSIMINFLEGCSVKYNPGSTGWDCKSVKPIDELAMMWAGTQSIRIKAYKGAVGSTLLADIDNIDIGEEVTVSGYAGAPNDVIWEIYKAGTSTKIGESLFHLSCSDEDMNGPEDCGKLEGDSKGKTGYINQWVLKGMAGSTAGFDCTP